VDAYACPDDLHRREQAGEVPTVTDVRGPDELRAGHAPGALNVPADQLQERLAEIPTDQPVVIF
jgi:rhodanese-related sulfurtransferase